MSLLLYCVLNKCHFHWPVALFTDILLWFLCPHILWRKLVSCFFADSYYFARGRRQRCDADCHTNLQFCLHTLSLPQGTVLLYSTMWRPWNTTSPSQVQQPSEWALPASSWWLNDAAVLHPACRQTLLPTCCSCLLSPWETCPLQSPVWASPAVGFLNLRCFCCTAALTLIFCSSTFPMKPALNLHTSSSTSGYILLGHWKPACLHLLLTAMIKLCIHRYLLLPQILYHKRDWKFSTFKSETMVGLRLESAKFPILGSSHLEVNETKISRSSAKS